MFKRYTIVTLILAILIGTFPVWINAEGLPELPRASVATSFTRAPEHTYFAHNSEEFKDALIKASPGDEIVLQAGTTYKGNFILSNNRANGFVTIRSDGSNFLPSSRVSPTDAIHMAKIVSPGKNLPAIQTDKGASGYRILGVEITKDPSSDVTNLILLGSGEETSTEDLPRNIILDRVYIHGDANSNLRRCVAMNGANMAVINSYISDCHEKGSDSQAIAGWNGTGPFLISNNYLEAASENVMFGGADPKINLLVPSDIEITDNYFYKPLSYKGKGWVVKNLLELKNARRVLIDGNVFENSWTEGQTGTALLFKSVNQNGKCPWCVTEHVTFSNNIVKNAVEGFRINGREGQGEMPQVAGNILFKNDVFENISGKLFQIFNGAHNITLDHITADTGSSILFGDAGNASTNPHLTITNSVLRRDRYGVGAGSEEGKEYLNKWFPDAVFANNVLISAEDISKKYPDSTATVSSAKDVRGNVGADLNAIKNISSQPELVINETSEDASPISTTSVDVAASSSSEVEATSSSPLPQAAGSSSLSAGIISSGVPQPSSQYAPSVSGNAAVANPQPVITSQSVNASLGVGINLTSAEAENILAIVKWLSQMQGR